ncbi:PEP-CTERM sorting domain-containing protein [Geobacter sp. SVR]|nr:PEP-CTERM sorting domain-containing protein [Geobacter sp. SVR]
MRFTVVLAVLFGVLVGQAHALVLFVDSFSTPTSNWTTTGNVNTVGISVSSVIQAQQGRYDLSSWGRSLTGGIALAQMNHDSQMVGAMTTYEMNPLSRSTPFSLSFNYGIAWTLVNPSGNTGDIGYVSALLRGDGKLLAEKDIQWSTTSTGPKSEITTGHITLPADYFQNLGTDFAKYTLEFDFHNTNNAFDAIVGIDDVVFDLWYTGGENGLLPVPVPAPVPEPASCLLLASGLAGLGAYAKRKRLGRKPV